MLDWHYFLKAIWSHNRWNMAVYLLDRCLTEGEDMMTQNSQHYQNLAVLGEIVEDEFARHNSSVTSLEMLDAVRPRYDQHPNQAAR